MRKLGHETGISCVLRKTEGRRKWKTAGSGKSRNGTNPLKGSELWDPPLCMTLYVIIRNMRPYYRDFRIEFP